MGSGPVDRVQTVALGSLATKLPTTSLTSTAELSTILLRRLPPGRSARSWITSGLVSGRGNGSNHHRAPCGRLNSSASPRLQSPVKGSIQSQLPTPPSAALQAGLLSDALRAKKRHCQRILSQPRTRLGWETRPTQLRTRSSPENRPKTVLFYLDRHGASDTVNS